MAATHAIPYEYHLVFGAHPTEAHFSAPRNRAPHVARVFVNSEKPEDGVYYVGHDLFVQHDFNLTGSLPGAVLETIIAAENDAHGTPWRALLASFEDRPVVTKPSAKPVFLALFHKMYFDHSVSKFVTWSEWKITATFSKTPNSILSLFGLLRPGGSLYIPEFLPLTDDRRQRQNIILEDVYYDPGIVASHINSLPLARDEDKFWLWGSTIPYMRSAIHNACWKDTRAYIPIDLPEKLLARKLTHSKFPAPVISLDFHQGYPDKDAVRDAHHAYPDIGLRERGITRCYGVNVADEFQYAHITLHAFHQPDTPLPSLHSTPQPQ